MLVYLPLIPYMATLGLFFSLRGPSVLFYLLLIPIFILLVRTHSFRTLIPVLVVPFLFYTCVGYFASQHETIYDSGEQLLVGTINQIPNIDGDRLALRLKTVEQEKIEVRHYFLKEEEKEQALSFGPGDYCRVFGTVTIPSTPTNFAQFDYRRYLQEQEIYWVMHAEQVSCVPSDSYTLPEKLERWRQQQMLRIEEQLSHEVASIVHALVFGDRTLMDETVLEAYQRLGVIHLLAVSGMHVGLIVATSFLLLIRIGVTRERAMECLMLLLPIYIVVAGGAPSVIRASSMSIVVLASLRFKQKLPPLVGITIVYLLYLIISPYSLFQLGFQLSFLVSFSLILSAKTIRTYHSYWKQLMIVTSVSQFIALPILLTNVYEIPWLSLPANILFIPLITMILLPLCFLGFISSLFIPINWNIPFHLLELIIPFNNQILTILSTHSFTTLIVGEPSQLLIFLMYVVIIYGMYCFERRKMHWWIRPGSLLLLIFIIQIGKPYLDSHANVTMIDVGQGDSFLIELPYRRGVYLIDTGGSIFFVNEKWRERKTTFDVGQDILIPTLKQRGISNIDGLILTHGHADHIGGAEAIARMMVVNDVYYSVGEVEGELEREVLSTLVNQGATIHFVKDGMEWTDHNVTFSILAPVGREQGLNDRSIVIYVELEGVTFLFTGDLEESGERMLLQRYPNLQVDVLKAGHHGSRTSTTEFF
ncbi:DNA internalization-related competence protein ComEC/Rec2 [Bacillus sp. JCM 19034]|uniref:DNA internalization-related competence protein ComEC/Rec2 n=1 Tax=Bacillus sp. JCM 19034 TaxID=1481928 RepID=UPI0007813CD1|nr:DNA internalization-related competence protein ComEC/Rec2 [Bacillus sp. JCM 19034]